MKIKSINQMPVGLAILWDDGTDSLIPCKVLRNACPCAYCSGETELLRKLNENSEN